MYLTKEGPLPIAWDVFFVCFGFAFSETVGFDIEEVFLSSLSTMGLSLSVDLLWLVFVDKRDGLETEEDGDSFLICFGKELKSNIFAGFCFLISSLFFTSSGSSSSKFQFSQTLGAGLTPAIQLNIKAVNSSLNSSLNCLLESGKTAK